MKGSPSRNLVVENQHNEFTIARGNWRYRFVVQNKDVTGVMARAESKAQG
jgi:hypothetical protein